MRDGDGTPLPVSITFLTKDRWYAQAGGYTAYGSSAERALKHLNLLIDWHDAPNGLQSLLAELKMNLSFSLAY